MSGVSARMDEIRKEGQKSLAKSDPVLANPECAANPLEAYLGFRHYVETCCTKSDKRVYHAPDFSAPYIYYPSIRDVLGYKF